MDVLSPKDGFVSALKFKDADNVQAGVMVLQLDSLDEDLRIARISTLEGLRKILAIRLSDAAIQISKDLASIPLKTANDVLPGLQGIYTGALQSEMQGHLPAGTAASLQPTLLTLTQQQIAGPLQLQLFDIKTAESNKINQLAADQLKKELDYGNMLKDRLKVTALASGNLKLKVAEGMFVRKGHVLFQIS